jgi:hypothetical protein
MSTTEDLRDVFERAVQTLSPPPALAQNGLSRGRRLRRRRTLMTATGGALVAIAVVLGSLAAAGGALGWHVRTSGGVSGIAAGELNGVSYRVTGGSGNCLTVQAGTVTRRDSSCWVDPANMMNSMQEVKMPGDVRVDIVGTDTDAKSVVFEWGSGKQTVRLTPHKISGIKRFAFVAVVQRQGDGNPHWTVYDARGESMPIGPPTPGGLLSARTCTYELTPSLIGGVALAAGTSYQTVQLHNDAAHACTLRTSPSVLLEDANGRQLGAVLHPPVGAVTVQFGQSATFSIGLWNGGNSPSACRPARAARIRITLAGGSPLTTPFTGAVCTYNPSPGAVGALELATPINAPQSLPGPS